MHNAEVERTVPAERLPVYEVDEGGDPLSAVLRVPAPDEPSPRANTGDGFVAGRRMT